MTRRSLSGDERQHRIQWKELLAAISNRGRRRTATQITEAVNAILKSWGKTQELSYVHVHLFRSIPKRQDESQPWDLRVPQTAESANALVWGLEDLGAWAQVSQSKKESEQRMLVELIGFEPLPRPPETGQPTAYVVGFRDLRGGQSLRGRTGVLRLLDGVADEAREENSKNNVSTLVVHIYSSIRFHTEDDPDIDDRIISCLEHRVRIVYVIGRDWDDDFPPETVKKNLRWSIDRAIRRAVDNNTDNATDMRNRLFAVTLPKPQVPNCHSRFGRDAFVSKLFKAHVNLTLTDLIHADVAYGWIEVVPELGADASGSSQWIVLPDASRASRSVATIWERIATTELKLEPLFEEQT